MAGDVTDATGREAVQLERRVRPIRRTRPAQRQGQRGGRLAVSLRVGLKIRIRVNLRVSPKVGLKIRVRIRVRVGVRRVVLKVSPATACGLLKARGRGKSKGRDKLRASRVPGLRKRAVSHATIEIGLAAGGAPEAEGVPAGSGRIKNKAS